MKAAAIAALALIVVISAAVACAPATPADITIIRVTPETRSTPPPRAALANPELASCLNFRTVRDDDCGNSTSTKHGRNAVTSAPRRRANRTAGRTRPWPTDKSTPKRADTWLPTTPRMPAPATPGDRPALRHASAKRRIMVG